FTLAHYNNWEWFSYWPMFSKFTGYAIYKKLKNKSFDLFYKNMRSRFGTIPLERADTYRQMISDARQKRVTATGFIMDQTP
ncbi:MAG: hypothetical protein LWW85_14115, partial [Marinilabiliales bacterium]|nr:hypothetical protein [Marinilabiliales bacterium]